jgi:hypothetical protein
LTVKPPADHSAKSLGLAHDNVRSRLVVPTEATATLDGAFGVLEGITVDELDIGDAVMYLVLFADG